MTWYFGMVGALHQSLSGDTQLGIKLIDALSAPGQLNNQLGEQLQHRLKGYSPRPRPTTDMPDDSPGTQSKTHPAKPTHTRPPQPLFPGERQVSAAGAIEPKPGRVNGATRVMREALRSCFA